MHIYLDTLDKD